MVRRMIVVAWLAIPCVALAGGNDGTGADDGPWMYFGWSTGVGSMAGPYSIDFSTESYLDVTDAYLDGDRFRVWVDGVDAGLTSMPTDTGASIGGDADAAFLDPMWSSGTFGPFTGMKDVTFEIVEIAEGYPGGGAYYRTNAVPEPASLLGFVLGALLFASRRR